MKYLFLILLIFAPGTTIFSQTGISLNDKNYFELFGFNVIVFDDFYPEGHQSGVTIVNNGERVAANGDVRIEPSPGQWSPIPKLGSRDVDRKNQEISVSLWYPDSSRNRKGFNPIIYPNLALHYKVRVKSAGQVIKIIVDLEKPLPPEWAGKVGFNLELFPGLLFGKSFIMDGSTGIFPLQPVGPFYKDSDSEYQIIPMAEGKELVIAPENAELNFTIRSESQKLILIDGRSDYNNGWFVIRSLLSANSTLNSLEWTITPNIIPDWKYKPVVQISQVGYHPLQTKIAVIETDQKDDNILIASVFKYNADGKNENVFTEKPKLWGNFLRYKYLQFDFSKITAPGIYKIKYGNYETNPFRISNNVYQRDVWQPTLEYFLPVQMCHMRVNEGYRVWHGLCHDDDALMSPTNLIHFDGYSQGPSTLTKYKPFEHVPNLNFGGWHDAGDYDLRVESQSQETWILSAIYEEFNLLYDATTINEKQKLVEIHKPDGKPDVLQQIEHGVLSIVNGYNSLGRLYRGIISSSLSQYVILGDVSTETDQKVYDSTLTKKQAEGEKSDMRDDRLVFTEENPYRELLVATGLAASSRALRYYNPELAKSCLNIAEDIWASHKHSANRMKIGAAAELFLTTNKNEYKHFLISNVDTITSNFERLGWIVARTLPKINDKSFKEKIELTAVKYHNNILAWQKENPYGIPYQPKIWGAGWNIQELGVHQYFMYKEFPDIFKYDDILDALNFILGCHPGSNTASFVSGVGVNSLTVAYGVNRADWSYIPGGVGSGTALIRPDLPELKRWPYFWQQTEYVMGGGATNFIFLVLAADKIMNHDGQ